MLWTLNWIVNVTIRAYVLLGLLLLTASGMEIGCTLFGFNAHAWLENSTKTELMLMHGMFFVGSVVGGFNAGFFVDSIGRRNTLVSAYEVDLSDW